jgi:hypothetical protein
MVSAWRSSIIVALAAAPRSYTWFQPLERMQTSSTATETPQIPATGHQPPTTN